LKSALSLGLAKDGPGSKVSFNLDDSRTHEYVGKSSSHSSRNSSSGGKDSMTKRKGTGGSFSILEARRGSGRRASGTTTQSSSNQHSQNGINANAPENDLSGGSEQGRKDGSIHIQEADLEGSIGKDSLKLRKAHSGAQGSQGRLRNGSEGKGKKQAASTEIKGVRWDRGSEE